MSPSLVVLPAGRVLADDVLRARTFVERGRGLLGRAEPGPRAALLIERARQVHTFGMAYPIDVCFCDRTGSVLHVVRNLRPRRVTRWVGGAAFVVEMRAGAMDGLAPGDQLSVEERSER